jgi:ATP-dependent Lhr-like helicase
VVAGEFRPDGRGDEWCDVDVLARIRRRSLARLRRAIEPVPAGTLGAFLPAWQHVRPARPGRDGRPPTPSRSRLAEVVDQLAGAPVPASALEPLVLPARVPGYAPAALDELTTAGEVVWAGRGRLPGGDGWIAVYPADRAPSLIGDPDPAGVSSPVHAAVLEVLSGGGAWFFRPLADRVAAQLGARDVGAGDHEVGEAIWDLVWSGHLTNDSLAPLRARLSAPPRPHRPLSLAVADPPGVAASLSGASAPTPVPPGGPAGLTPSARTSHVPGGPRRLGRPRLPTRHGPPTLSGRWSLVPAREPDPTRRAHALVETLLDRYGVLTRGTLAAEGLPGGYAGVYPVLAALEEAGRVRRGYVVAGLGAAQFASTGAIDRLRAVAGDLAGGAPPGGDHTATGSRRVGLTLAAADPANPYGAALPWPAPPHGGHRPARKAGALVVLVDGALVWYLERGGRTLLCWSQDDAELTLAARALADLLASGSGPRVRLERVNGHPITASPAGHALQTAGFGVTPQGLRWHG